MQAVVGHHHWGRPGGEQLLVAATAASLSETRRVKLASLAKFNPNNYLGWFGIDLTDFEIVTLPFGLSAFGLYSRLLVWYTIRKAIGKETDLVFLDEHSYRPLLGLKKKYKFKLVEYIHFPIEKSIALNRRNDPYVTERYSHFPMSLYWQMYLKLVKLVVRKNPFESADVVLANSKWTANMVRGSYGEMPIILNPPVPPNVQPKGSIPQFEERENYVVMVGRFTEEKRYRWVIENIAPRLKGSSRIFLFGGAGTPGSKYYRNSLMARAVQAGLTVADNIHKEADIYFISDAPREQINEIIDKSRVFLHATINEHWGIVVSEAMTRGVPIVIHESGGSWSDLAQEGLSGLGFRTADEAIDSIELLKTDKKKWKAFQKEGLERVKALDMKSYSEKLSRLC